MRWASLQRKVGSGARARRSAGRADVRPHRLLPRRSPAVPRRGRHSRGTALHLLALAGTCLLAECLTAPAVLAAPSPSTVGLQPSDVPGYSPVAPTLTSLTSTTLPRALRQCAPNDPLLSQFGTSPSATISSLYGQGAGPFGVPSLLVGTAVFTDGSTADAERAYTLLDSPSVQSCWLSTEDTITTAITSGLATLLTAKLAALPALSLGSNVESTGFVFHETVSVFGQTVRDSVEIAPIHVGAIVTLLFTLATDETFPESVRASVAHAVASRMGAETSHPPPTTTPTTPSTVRICQRSGIPDTAKPVLTNLTVHAILRSRVHFTGETTNGSSICVWSVRTPSKVRTPSVPAVLTTTWQVLIDGPLTSSAAARHAYQQFGSASSLNIGVPNLGDAAELLPGTAASPAPRLLVRAARYVLQFSSVTANDSPTVVATLHGLATAVLVRLKFAPSQSSSSMADKSWSTPHWAGPKFCKSYHQPALATFRGVASCGQRFVNTASNTTPKPICYPAHKCRNPGIDFDTTGFQCVEYADRYFYFVTGIGSFPADPGSDTAEALYYKFHGKNPQLGLVPMGRTAGTSRYATSLVKGDIISMWKPHVDLTGHVGVVKSVHVTKGRNGKYTGRITMINENAQHGVTPIKVTTNVLTYGGGYFTTFQWLTGLPTS